MNDRVSRRSLFIDASRGLAMLLVCVSHFGIAYFGRLGDVRSNHLTSLIALPSTATFIVLSGLLLGFLHLNNPASFANLSLKLMDRGLFLLGPAHGLIMIAHFVIFRNVRFFFVTDAIGICLLLGPRLVSRLSGTTRAVIGVGMIAFTWSIYLTWNPTGNPSALMHSILIGDVPFKHGWLTFPVLPWMGAYLLATPLGDKLAAWKKSGDAFVIRLAAISLFAILAGVGLHLLGRGRELAIRELLSAIQKYPPGPAYLLASGGIGLGVTAIVAWLEGRQLLQRILAGFAVVGRSSLVVFVVQYFVYYAGIFSLRLPASHLWPAFLALSLALIFGVAYWWDRYVGNEYLTVGLPYLIRARNSSPSLTER